MEKKVVCYGMAVVDVLAKGVDETIFEKEVLIVDPIPCYTGG